jgi:hypothetical protein
MKMIDPTPIARRITHETYAKVLDVMSKFGYGRDDEAAAALRDSFGLAPYKTYKIVIVPEGSYPSMLAKFGLA